LIDSNARGDAHDIGLRTQGAAKLNGVGAVETSGAVIPALQGRVAQSGFSDGDALPLAAADAADKVVTDPGVPGVGDAKHGHDDVAHMLGVFGFGKAAGDKVGAARASSKVKGIAYGELREVVVNLGSVDGFTAVFLLHLLRTNTLVVKGGILGDVEAVSIAGNGSQQSRAAGAGRAEDTQHLAAVDDTLEVAQDIDPLLPAPADYVTKNVGALEEGVGDGLLVVCRGAEAVDTEVLEGHTGCTWLCAVGGRGAGAVVGLCPLAGVELRAVRVERTVGLEREEVLVVAIFGTAGHASRKLVDVGVNLLSIGVCVFGNMLGALGIGERAC
jgi:hypothetical protein